MIFEATAGSGFWCSVLDTCYSDLFILVDWLNLIKFEWMVYLVMSEVQWLFDSLCQSFQWLIDSAMVYSEIDDWFQLCQRLMIEFQWLVLMVVLQWWLILSFNVTNGSSVKILWNVAFIM